MPAKVFTATLEGKCLICKKEMKGTRITKDNKTGQYVHADCLWPNKSKTNTHFGSEPHAKDSVASSEAASSKTTNTPANPNKIPITPPSSKVAGDSTLPPYPLPITQAEIDLMLKNSKAKAEELSNGENLVLANSIFKAVFIAREEAFNVALAKATNARIAKQMEQKAGMVKDVRGR